MTMLLLLQLIAWVVLFVCSAFFSSSEVALFSLAPLQMRRLKTAHPQAARRLRYILEPPTRFLSTILIGNTLVNVLISVLGFVIAIQIFPQHGEWAAIGGMTLLLLLFGEVMPKRIAFLWPERLAVLYAAPLTVIMHALSPLRIALEYSTDSLQPLFKARGRTLSEDEFETLVDVSSERGVLHAGERDMLKSILRLEDLEARDVMTPRVDLIGYDLNSGESDLVEIARRAKVRHLVLFRDSLDRVEGLLDIRRFLLDASHRVQPAWSPPLYIPESARLDRLLEQFLHERRRAAVVVDEYGGTAGIITRGDMLEEITGDIDDELADHSHLFEPEGPETWILDGQISLEEINQKLDLHLEAEGVDRLAGWIAAQLERLPRAGDRVTHQGCRVVVRQMRWHRVTLVMLERIASAGDADEERSS